MSNPDKFIKLFKELEPLKKSIAGNFDYRQLRFTYDDIVGFLDEKLFHVFIKYEHKPFEEQKALAISSLIALKAKLYKKYNRERNIESPEAYSREDETDFHLQLLDLLINIKPHLSKQQYNLAKLILIPPVYVLTRASNPDKRIPSHLFLEFLGQPSDKYAVKRLNKFRKHLFLFIRENFNRDTFEFQGTGSKILKK